MIPINAHHKTLLEKKEDLLQGLQDRSGLKIEGRAADPLDEANESAARTHAVDRINRNAELLKRVNKAIDKILHGDFGECEGCGGEIPPARLGVVPWAEFCFVCQHELESRQSPLSR